TIKEQKPHPDPVKGTTIEEQDHPTTSEWVAGLLATGKVEWINCGLCVDERGAGDWIDGARRGGPADLINWSNESDNTLIMGTR
ncbi:MAG: DsrE family protein, partial [Chloroflexi bacterium]|nr:DsrE family protein [Chloroflexota bacterium]